MRRTALFLAAVILGVIFAVALGGTASAASSVAVGSSGKPADLLVVLLLAAVPVVGLAVRALLPPRADGRDEAERGMRALARQRPR